MGRSVWRGEGQSDFLTKDPNLKVNKNLSFWAGFGK